MADLPWPPSWPQPLSRRSAPRRGWAGGSTGQPERAALYRELVAADDLPPGHGLDEQAAGVFRDGRLEAVLADEPSARVHEVGGPPDR